MIAIYSKCSININCNDYLPQYLYCRFISWSEEVLSVLMTLFKLWKPGRVYPCTISCIFFTWFLESFVVAVSALDDEILGLPISWFVRICFL